MLFLSQYAAPASVIVWLWAVSVASLLLSALMLSRQMRQRRQKISRLMVDQGGSVNLQFVLLLPLIVGSLVFVVEASNFLVGVLGLRSACAAATRSAIVWLPAELKMDPMGHSRLGRVRDAAVRNWMPFVSGAWDANEFESHLAAHRKHSMDQFLDELASMQRGQIRSRYLRNQYLLAETVSVELRVSEDRDRLSGSETLFQIGSPTTAHFIGGGGEPDFQSAVEVRLTAWVPFRTPLLGRMLGERPWPGASFYARRVTATYTLHKEAAQSPDQTLGIKNVYTHRTFFP